MFYFLSVKISYMTSYPVIEKNVRRLGYIIEKEGKRYQEIDLSL